MNRIKNEIEKVPVRLISIAREYSAVLFIVGIVGIYIAARCLSNPDNHAQVKFLDVPDHQTSAEQSGSDGTITDVFSGTKYETAKRLRESAALGIATSLAVFSKYRETGSLPQTRREVISDVVSRKLLPPEISVEKEGFRSPTSSIRLNFRLSPFSFEILSLPVEDEFGPAMLFQFPLPPSAQNSVRYFRSKISTSPAPFSTIEQLAAQGWEIGQWSIDELKLDRSSVDGLQEQNEWLKLVNAVPK